MTSAFARVVEELGPINILVTNAGFAEETPVTAMSASQFDRMIAVHLRGTFLCTRAVLPGMFERESGVIITMASQLAYIGAESLAHYAAAKGGIVAYTKSLAREAIRHGIRVNGIAPGRSRPAFSLATQNSTPPSPRGFRSADLATSRRWRRPPSSWPRTTAPSMSVRSWDRTEGR